jgi:aconitate decarboxylase
MLAPVVPTGDRPHPRTGLEGKFSMQYTLAAALLDGAVTLTSFTDERLHRRDMQTLLGKISVTMTPEITTEYNAGRYVDLEVELADGTIIRERCERPRGSWGAEPISEAEHLVKVGDCLAGSLTPSAIDEFVELGSRFEQLDGNGVRRMLALACGETGARC